MTSRQRIQATLNHVQPDKIPVDIGSHRSSAFSVGAYVKLRKHLGLEPKPLYIYDMIQQLVIPDDDILDMFGCDIIDYARPVTKDPSLWKEWTMPNGEKAFMPVKMDIRYDGDGSHTNNCYMYNRHGKPIAVKRSTALYFDQTVFSYRDIDEDHDFNDLEEALTGNMWSEFDSYPSPLTFEGTDRERRIQLLEDARQTDRALFGNFGANIYETGGFLFKMDNWLMNLAAEPEMIERYLDKMTEICLGNMERFMSLYAGKIDVMGFGDDLGSQHGPQISPKMYREMFKPYHTRLWKRAKELDPNIKLCLHCCGDISLLLEDLIDAGMDAFNPIQIACPGMDLIQLKKDFGKDMTFWGGGCDTQQVLTHGTAEEVYAHTSRNLEILFRDGGFVFQQVHNIQPNVPPENIVAMHRAVKEFSN